MLERGVGVGWCWREGWELVRDHKEVCGIGSCRSVAILVAVGWLI